MGTNVKSRLSRRAVAALIAPVFMWSLGLYLMIHVSHADIYPWYLSVALFEATFAYILMISFAPVGIFLSVSALRSIRKNTNSLHGFRYAIEGFIISIFLLLISAYFMFHFFRFLPDFHFF